jgi:hypothetical protein
LDEGERKREDEWFLRNEQQLIEAARVAREKRAKERAAQEQAEERERVKKLHYMKCPKCGHDMATEQLDGVEVERCTFCEGIYFDAGELDRVLTKRGQEAKGFFRRLIKA